MDAPRPFVDLHLHAEGLRDEDLRTLALFGLRAALTCSRDAAAASAEGLRRHWEDLVGLQARRLAAAGIRPLVALGVHPARIPWLGLEGLLAALPHYFDDPKVAALGELGLQLGTPGEEELFARQLELAASLRRPVLVHTPAEEKLPRTRRVLSLLREARLLPERVLVDHVGPETLPLVRALGYRAGLTLQPGGFGAAAACAAVRAQGAEGLVLTSDLGEGPGDLLALPRAGEELRAAGLSEELCRRLLYQGPQEFLAVALD